MNTQGSTKATNMDTLGDEFFMSADDLRKYMMEMKMAHVSQELNAMTKADEARRELIRSLQEHVDVTPEKIAELKQRLQGMIRRAAANGETETMVMRFPNALCTDGGRAINNTEPDWPKTLTGRPRQAYEFWKEHLQPAKYTLKAMIIEFPGGFPGDVGFFLSWS
ncbi:hypothetical protein GCM10007874_47020 [Labrys miyagiensis]|uniref:Uncharacterized protein n=2 Tax=Labrys miyagiensis TaxID=346912 RepID=A0ABQ6CRV5_9HYPH|nr:hypothetical protein GCM10007874_47020 [Labrys miyagiensis]